MNTAAIAEMTITGINDRDWSQIEKLAAEDIQLRLPPGQVFYGHEGVRDFFTELQRRMNDLTITAQRIYSGDDFAIVEYEALGHPSKHGEMEDMGVIVLHVEGGRVRRCHVYLDMAKWRDMA